jgi:hypothetical protein
MRRLASLLIAAIVVTLWLWFTAVGHSRTREPSYSAILQRSFWTMAAITAVHGKGHFTERELEPGDTRSAGSWRVQGDCATRGATTTSRFAVQGSQTGRHARAVDEQYTVRLTRVEALAIWRWPWRVWVRTVHPAATWHRTGVSHDAQMVESMCPSLIMRQPLPGPVQNMGRIRIRGRSVEHLHSEISGQGGGQTVDLYVDPTSFRWVRVRLSGWGAGCCHTYFSRFDYSRYNAPLTARLPARGIAQPLSTLPGAA